MTSPAPVPNWTHPAVPVRVIDGDTFVARIDLGKYFGGGKALVEGPVRIAGLYAPELRQEGGPEARDALSLLLGDRVILRTRKPDPRDAYGRIVAEAWTLDGQNIAEALIVQGHGRGS